MENVFVSVVIITKNRTHHIKKCLQKLMDQTYKNFEIIIVDSSDNSSLENELSMYEKYKYYYIGTISNTCISKNYGIKKAKGDIVAFLDDDSEPNNIWIQECLNGYISKEVGGVTGRVIEPDSRDLDHLRTAPICKILKNGLLTDNLDCITDSYVEVQHFRGCNMSFRKEVLDSVGGFDEKISSFYDDLDISLKVISIGYKLLFNSNMFVVHNAAPTIYPITIYIKHRRNMYLYLKIFGLKYVKQVGFISLQFFFLAATGIISFVKKPGKKSFIYMLDSIKGKCMGIKDFLLRNKV